MYAGKRRLSIVVGSTWLSAVWTRGGRSLFENSAERQGQLERWRRVYGWVRTGVKGGEMNVGVGSRVERAEAPVSPRRSVPRLLDFRRGPGIFPRDEMNVIEKICTRSGLWL